MKIIINPGSHVNISPYLIYNVWIEIFICLFLFCFSKAQYIQISHMFWPFKNFYFSFKKLPVCCFSFQNASFFLVFAFYHFTVHLVHSVIFVCFLFLHYSIHHFKNLNSFNLRVSCDCGIYLRDDGGQCINHPNRRSAQKNGVLTRICSASTVEHARPSQSWDTV